MNGDLYIVVGVAPGLVSEDAMKQHTDIRIIKFDWDLNMVGETKIPFEYAQEVAFAGGFEAPDPENPAAVGFDGGIVVFAPMDVPGKYAPPIDPDKSNFTYVEFDKDLNIIGRETFQSPSPGWNIGNFAWGWNEDGGREIFVYGPAALGKDKYHALAQTSTKLKSIQLLHTSSGKV